jgi:hypothetical protein
MNIKTRKLIRQLVLDHPELSSEPQKLLDLHYGNVQLEQPLLTPIENIAEQLSIEQINFESLDWNSILELAKLNNITNYRKMKKSELVSILTELQNECRLTQIN